MTEGQYLPAHFHAPCDFSTIHYLNFKDGHELTCFKNPADYAPYTRHLQPELVDILNKKDPDNSYMFTNYNISVEEDDFIIFPCNCLSFYRQTGTNNRTKNNNINKY